MYPRISLIVFIVLVILGAFIQTRRVRKNLEHYENRNNRLTLRGTVEVVLEVLALAFVGAVVWPLTLIGGAGWLVFVRGIRPEKIYIEEEEESQVQQVPN
jgi:hypothetical protein